jgi:hypothetical protein
MGMILERGGMTCRRLFENSTEAVIRPGFLRFRGSRTIKAAPPRFSKATPDGHFVASDSPQRILKQILSAKITGQERAPVQASIP